MTCLPDIAAARVADWPDLLDEFDRWRACGRTARLWWRDDDAITATPQLDDLLRLAEGVPLALAAIPAEARPELAAALRDRPDIAVLQHGWRHANRAAEGKKNEYPPGRPAAEVTAEIAEGRARLEELFGPSALPVFVPPWNRFAGEYLPLLRDNGVRAISVMKKNTPSPPPGERDLPAQLDVHFDPVAWRGDRGFTGAAAALDGLIRGLRAMRVGEDPSPALGILTHHLVMDAKTAAFLATLIAVLGAHQAAQWAGVGELLA